MKATIYARFSNLEQAEGASTTRQFRDCRAFCADRQWTVAAELLDKGKSAFSGANRVTGAALATYIAEALDGLHQGEALVVERLDRLSRQGFDDTYRLIVKLSQAGVTVATVDGGSTYRANEKLEATQVIFVLMLAERAHEESATKAQRVRDGKAFARQRARDEGRTLTKNLKPWLTLDATGNRVVIEDRAVIVREIFRKTFEETMGATRMVRWLHKQGIAAWGEGKRASDGWHESFINRLLKDRAVLGEYQPHTFVDGQRVPEGEPIIGYFPAIVDPALFASVNASAPHRKSARGGGKSEKIANLVSGLVRCRHCGGTMRYREKRAEGSFRIVNGKRYRRTHADASFICTRAERHLGGCTNMAAISYHRFEQGLLDACLHIALDDESFSNRGEVGRLNSLIAERATAVERAESRSKRLWSAWADDGSDAARSLAKEADDEAKGLRENLEALERQREQAKGRASSAEHLRRVADVRSKLHDPDLEVRVPLRRKVAEALHAIISRITGDETGVEISFTVPTMGFVKLDRQGRQVVAGGMVTADEDHEVVRRLIKGDTASILNDVREFYEKAM